MGITLQASFNPERWEGEAAVLIVKVETPVFLSPFAFICYAVVIIGLVVLIMSLIKKREIKKIKTNIQTDKDNPKCTKKDA